MIQLLIDRCIIFVSLELLLFKYNSNNSFPLLKYIPFLYDHSIPFPCELPNGALGLCFYQPIIFYDKWTNLLYHGMTYKSSNALFIHMVVLLIEVHLTVSYTSFKMLVRIMVKLLNSQFPNNLTF